MGEAVKWPQVIEAWAFYDKDGNVSSHEVSGQCPEYEARRERELAQDPDVVRLEKVWEIKANSWTEAMTAWHEHQGFGPYSPPE